MPFTLAIQLSIDFILEKKKSLNGLPINYMDSNNIVMRDL